MSITTSSPHQHHPQDTIVIVDGEGRIVPKRLASYAARRYAQVHAHLVWIAHSPDSLASDELKKYIIESYLTPPGPGHSPDDHSPNPHHSLMRSDYSSEEWTVGVYFDSSQGFYLDLLEKYELDIGLRPRHSSVEPEAPAEKGRRVQMGLQESPRSRSRSGRQRPTMWGYLKRTARRVVRDIVGEAGTPTRRRH